MASGIFDSILPFFKFLLLAAEMLWLRRCLPRTWSLGCVAAAYYFCPAWLHCLGDSGAPLLASLWCGGDCAGAQLQTSYFKLYGHMYWWGASPFLVLVLHLSMHIAIAGLCSYLSYRNLNEYIIAYVPIPVVEVLVLRSCLNTQLPLACCILYLYWVLVLYLYNQSVWYKHVWYKYCSTFSTQ